MLTRGSPTRIYMLPLSTPTIQQDNMACTQAPALALRMHVPSMARLVHWGSSNPCKPF